MSAKPRTRLGGSQGYQRPASSVLDDLTDPGPPGTRVVSVVGDTLSTQGTSGTERISVPLDTRDTPINSVTSGVPGPKPTAEPRTHVKVAASLAGEMRDAVWFLSEHGRPRVQLGELFDEAVRAWLDAAKAEHNGGEPFPVRGRLR